MNNISERYQVSAMPIHGKERVQGYLFHMNYNGCFIACIATEPISANDYGEIYFDCYEEIDESTIQPVKVCAIIRSVYNNNLSDHNKKEFLGRFAYCPNCDKLLEKLEEPIFCSQCGMAITI